MVVISIRFGLRRKSPISCQFRTLEIQTPSNFDAAVASPPYEGLQYSVGAQGCVLSFLDEGDPHQLEWNSEIVLLMFGSRFFLIFAFNPTNAALVLLPLCYAYVRMSTVRWRRIFHLENIFSPSS